MKEIKLSFPYPATSRHNLSQDVATSLSMGLVIPVRIVEVLAGDSHRIGTSFSLISNPLVKPLLQGVRMRLARFWVPRRIYHLNQRANNSQFDPRTSQVRWGVLEHFRIPSDQDVNQYSNFQSSCLFDYLSLANIESNSLMNGHPVALGPEVKLDSPGVRFLAFNAETYLSYIDICRNFFSDSASGTICWSVPRVIGNSQIVGITPLVTSLSVLDSYIDGVQNSEGKIAPYNYFASDPTLDGYFSPVFLSFSQIADQNTTLLPGTVNGNFNVRLFGLSHMHLCVPVNRPDRLSRLFNTDPLTSQNATIAPNEITIANLSFLSKLQRYLTRRFFGGSRFTDVMYSVFGQKVPHVDSPTLLDVFDYEIGSELVASTNATDTQNPGVLGGFFSASGKLVTSRGGFKRRYTFNEPGYIFDVVTIMPRLIRSSFYPDYFPVVTDTYESSGSGNMSQGNFIPDFNGIGWQQPSTLASYLEYRPERNPLEVTRSNAFCCEPSWQQYRTLPDVSHGLLNPLRGIYSLNDNLTRLPFSVELNSPLFVFNDRMSGRNFLYYNPLPSSGVGNDAYFRYLYTDFNDYNRVFGFDTLTYDNIFAVFAYSHQAKRQVTKRFTLSF